jgi:hypothetical protein
MMVRARILLLTEDTGNQAQPTVQKILKEALKLVMPGADLNPARIRIEPLLDNERALQAVSRNNWKEHPPTRDTIILREAIAARLLEPAGFVIFHFDTDRVWAERHKSENRDKFKVIIREGVRRILRGEAPLPFPQRPRPILTPEQIEAALERLLVLSPCYTMESWLYQATKETLAYCREEHDSNEHAQRIESWAKDRTLLDEVLQPKDNKKEGLTCVGDKHNAELAKSFPAEEVWHAKRSFFESVERLRACTALVEALGY